jgi:hypothetical protein
MAYDEACRVGFQDSFEDRVFDAGVFSLHRFRLFAWTVNAL